MKDDDNVLDGWWDVADTREAVVVGLEPWHEMVDVHRIQPPVEHNLGNSWRYRWLHIGRGALTAMIWVPRDMGSRVGNSVSVGQNDQSVALKGIVGGVVEIHDLVVIESDAFLSDAIHFEVGECAGQEREVVVWADESFHGKDSRVDGVALELRDRFVDVGCAVDTIQSREWAVRRRYAEVRAMFSVPRTQDEVLGLYLGDSVVEALACHTAGGENWPRRIGEDAIDDVREHGVVEGDSDHGWKPSRRWSAAAQRWKGERWSEWKV